MLCEDGSHGLDLSFVTHLFILNPILDAALERQVVSRAHHMGLGLATYEYMYSIHVFRSRVNTPEYVFTL